MSRQQDILAEQAVIGSLMIDFNSERCQEVLKTITSDDMFYSYHNKLIFNSIKKLSSQKKPVDLLTVEDELSLSGELQNIGGIAALAEICRVPITTNVNAYADIVKNKYLERLALSSVRDCQELLMGSSSTENKLSNIQKLLTDLDVKSKSNNASGLSAISKINENWLTSTIERMDSPNLPGLSSGIAALDNILQPKGIIKGSLFVIGARPKAGKTALMVKMALKCSETKPALIFSLEMTTNELYERMITQISGVSNNIFYNKNYGNDNDFDLALSAANRIVEDGNIFIDDTPKVNIYHIQSEARRIKREKGTVGAIFIDYLTLMNPPKADRNDLAWGEVTKELKALAKELECVVVLLTQLNRGLESRTDKRPFPSDSRETGQIEQDCDYWAGIYKESLYKEDADKNLTEVILRLNRHGETGTVYVNSANGQLFETNQIEARNIAQKIKETQKRYAKNDF